MKNKNIKLLTYSSLLIAISIIIPIQFRFLRIEIGPFSATILSHLPLFLSMMISPFSAVIVGIGSTVGFFIAGSAPWIVARAATHIVVGFVGAKLFKKGVNFISIIAITAPIHGGLELLSVLPWYGFDLYKLLVVVALGTVVHHGVDGTITYILSNALDKATGKKFYENVSINK
ncbi:hypothetical protein [Clostridium polynesiense]|uniref:hypothetical protein n=1 Tax=Clostridium polynesiense TaxID=1325933 RepID=UPI00058B969A|nr:hypothetical protein [Clostridium polynesiense]